MNILKRRAVANWLVLILIAELSIVMLIPAFTSDLEDEVSFYNKPSVYYNATTDTVDWQALKIDRDLASK